jgi:hypothetical protein
MNSKRNFVPFLALAILLLVSLACGSSTSPTLVATSAPPVDSGSQQEQPTQAPAPVTQQNYKVGDVVAIGDHFLVVLGCDNVQPNDFIKPDAGKKFVAVELLIVNNSQS